MNDILLLRKVQEPHHFFSLPLYIIIVKSMPVLITNNRLDHIIIYSDYCTVFKKSLVIDNYIQLSYNDRYIVSVIVLTYYYVGNV